MAGIKSLAKDTAIYGLSSIVGRFLNWCLVPLYTYVFPSGEYGKVSFLYSLTAVALVILNYGMETGLFRYANKERDPMRVYSTSLLSVGATSLLFIAAVTLLLEPVSRALLMPDGSLYIGLLAVTVAVDAFTNIPFAYLRFRSRPVRFALIKCTNVAVNISLNLFFILLCPLISGSSASWLIDWFYAPAGGADFGIGWIFVANILSTLVVLAMLLPEVVKVKYSFDTALWRRMLSYSWPLLILGVAGILSQNMGQTLIPYLFPDNAAAAQSMVGVYSANMKIALVMVMFTQAFRYAYEPFIFAQARGKGEDKTQAYCDAMKFFVIFGLLIFLGVMYYLPVLRHFISRGYWEGLRVVPVMMLAELCFGVFFNLSLWYKLTDRTRWGMYFSLAVFVMMLALNIWLVPAIGIPDGYMGSAYAALVSYAVIMVVSYFVGRHYYPLPYQVGRMALYAALAAVLYFAGTLLPEEGGMLWLTYTVRTLLLAAYAAGVCVTENVPVISPLVRRLLRLRRNDAKTD